MSSEEIRTIEIDYGEDILCYSEDRIGEVVERLRSIIESAIDCDTSVSEVRVSFSKMDKIDYDLLENEDE